MSQCLWMVLYTDHSAWKGWGALWERKREMVTGSACTACNKFHNHSCLPTNTERHGRQGGQCASRCLAKVPRKKENECIKGREDYIIPRSAASRQRN